MRTTLLCVAVLLAPEVRAAEPPEPEAPAEPAEPATVVAAPADEPGPAALPSLEIAIKGGVHLPQLVNKLGTSFDGILMVGYAPFKARQLQFFVDLGYSQPSQQSSATDPRLGASGSDYSATLVVKDLAVSLGLSFFFLPPSRFVVPYAGLGVRAHFLRAEVTGASGAEFGQNNETDTRFGGVAFAGVGLRLGPGLLFAELAFGYAPVAQHLTGINNVGALSILAGYGLLL